MARTRLINPEFFLHEGLGQCSPHARLLFIALWTQADREGRLRWLPLRIHGEAFPHEPRLSIEKLGQELCEAGVLTLYSSGGKRLAHIRKFSLWQSPHRNETASKLAPPPVGALVAVPDKGQPKDNQGKVKGPHDTSPSTSPSTCPNTRTSTPTPEEEWGALLGHPIKLARELREAISTHSPAYAKRAKKKQLRGWAEVIEKLIRIDGASPEDVSRVIRWAHTHPDGAFWRSNLLSGTSLRKQFPRLLLQSQTARKEGVDVDAAAVAAALELGAQL